MTGATHCYAVVFTSHRDAGDDDAYQRMAQRMSELARTQPGYLGEESARGDDGFGITISYWESMDAIAAWKAHSEHQLAQQLGRERWYLRYTVRVLRVEREYHFAREADTGIAASGGKTGTGRNDTAAE